MIYTEELPTKAVADLQAPTGPAAYTHSKQQEAQLFGSSNRPGTCTRPK